MKEGRAALRYAKAILDLAIDKKIEVEVNSDMSVISSTIHGSDELKNLLNNPVINPSDKINSLNVLFKDTTPLTKDAFKLLVENKRLGSLGVVAEKFIILYNKHKGISLAKVTTAVALTKELEDKIRVKIVSLVGNNVVIENVIDESILGGFIIKVGDRQFDASLSSKFGKLRREFDGNHSLSS